MNVMGTWPSPCFLVPELETPFHFMVTGSTGLVIMCGNNLYLSFHVVCAITRNFACFHRKLRIWGTILIGVYGHLC